MPLDPIKCSDDTQQITIHLPCRLAERVGKYAKENGNTVTGVVIEALDALLRGGRLIELSRTQGIGVKDTRMNR